MKTLILSLVLGLFATAEPAWLKEINIPEKGSLRKIPPTKLEYVISFNGKGKAGTFSILFGEKAPRYPDHSWSVLRAEVQGGPNRSSLTNSTTSVS